MRSNLLSAVAATTLIATGTPALAVAAPPAGVQTQQVDGVEYISGGAGEDQRAGMRAVSESYNLKIVTALESGSYVSNAQVSVSDATTGKDVLSTQATGPLFYANVPEGRYRVTAATAGQTQTREVRVGSGLSPEVTFKFRTPARAASAPAKRASTPPVRAAAPAQMPAADEPRLTRAELDGHVSLYNLAPSAPSQVAPPGARTVTPAEPTLLAQSSYDPQPTRAETEGHISLYNLDPMAAERAQTQVEVFEVYPDGTQRRVDPNAVTTMPAPAAPAPEEADAVIINIQPAPGTGVPPAR